MGVPEQVAPPLVYVGVTVIVPVIGVVPPFTAVNAAILPVPPAPRPMAVLLLIQLYEEPATAPVNVIAVVIAPAHTVWLLTAFTVGIGLTVIVKFLGIPGHVTPAFVNTGVTVMVATTTVVPPLMAVKDAIFPVPLAGKPIDVLLFVQL